MNNKFEPLQSGEVLSVNQSNQFLIEHNTFRTSEFTKALQHKMMEESIGGLTEGKVGWLTEEGIECEVLKFGSNGWQKGKVRIYLEFCPDESVGNNVSASNASDTGQTTFSESSNQDLDDFSMEEDNFSMEEEDLGFEAQVTSDETQSTDMASDIDDEFSSLEETVDNQNGLTLEDNLDNSEDALDLGDFADEDTDKLTFSGFESNNESENGQDENSFDDVWEDINQPI